MTFVKRIDLKMVVLGITFFSFFAFAQNEIEEQENVELLASQKSKSPKTYGVKFGGVPALSLSKDSGFGFGVAGSVYKTELNLRPYKWNVGALVYFTTTGAQNHSVSIDYLDVMGLPLRLWGQVGFRFTKNEYFCGKGSEANCDESVANKMAQQRGLTGKAADDFVWQYYRYRNFDFSAQFLGRWGLTPFPNKVELLFGWQGHYYLPGGWGDLGPYPNSLYANTFKENDEKGFSSVLQAGINFDDRDNEAAPTRGYWVESTIRGSTPAWGSKWTWGGVNIAGRHYLPLIPSRKLVFANQLMFDGIVGDAALNDMVRIGGILGGNGYTAFGGQYIGRGILQQKYPGRVKVIGQSELRYMFLDFGFWDQDFSVGAVAFGDFGMSAWDFKSLTKVRQPIFAGFGPGARIIWNEVLVIRFDLAFSASDKYAMQYYIKIGNVF